MIKKRLHKLFLEKMQKKWKYIYMTFDIHGTILKPCWNKKETFKYFHYAKETLQLISKRDDIKIIIWSSSHDDKLKMYEEQFKQDNIRIDYINHNPEINTNQISDFSYKFYTDIGFDDKFGFNPKTDWKIIYKFFKKNKKI